MLPVYPEHVLKREIVCSRAIGQHAVPGAAYSFRAHFVDARQKASDHSGGRVAGGSMLWQQFAVLNESPDTLRPHQDQALAGYAHQFGF